tara:strand:+ start:747 stop:1805 length:1059 start_codon:yes stop_codon:yes gene_type:complete
VFISLTLAPLAAESKIGSITELKGTGSVVRKSPIPAKLQLGIEMRDDIRTGNGRIKIDFLDGSILRVTEQSKVIIDEFVYDSNPSKSKLAVNFVSGTARFATGKMNKIDKKNISIKTPTSQIAVRGTDFTITVDELGRSLVILLPDENGAPSGEILVATNGGSVVLNKSMQSTVAFSSDSAPTKPAILDLSLDQINNMIIVNPPKIVEQEKDEMVLEQDALAYNELDTDYLAIEQERYASEFNEIDIDYLEVDFLADVIPVMIEVDKLQAATLGEVRSTAEIIGTSMGLDAQTGLLTVLNKDITISKDNNGKIKLVLDGETAYNIMFNLDGKEFNVVINGGDSSTIIIRQKK